MIVSRIREMVSFELGKNDTVLSLLILAVCRIQMKFVINLAHCRVSVAQW